MNQSESVRPIDVGVLWRRGWIVVLAAIVGSGIAYLHARHAHKQFSATSELLFGSSSVDNALGLGNSSAASSQVGVLQATNQDLVGLPVILQRTQSALAASTPASGFSVSSSASGSSNIVNVTATAGTASLAAQVANTYAREFVAYTLANQQTEVRQAISAIQGSIAGASSKRSGSPGKRPAAGADSTTTSAQVTNLQLILGQLETILVSKPLNVSIVQPATVPTHASGPHKSREALLGFVIGFVVGLIFAILIEALDPRLHSAAAAMDGEIEVLQIGRGRSGSTTPRPIALRLVRRMRQSRLADSSQSDAYANGIILSGSGGQESILRALVAVETAEAAADSGLRTAMLRIDGEAGPETSTSAHPPDAFTESVADADDPESSPEQINKADASGETRTEISDLAGLVAQNDHVDGLDVYAAKARVFTDDAEMVRLLQRLRSGYEFVLVDVSTSDISASGDALISGANTVVVAVSLHSSSRRGVARQIDRIRGLRADDPVLVTVPNRRSLKALSSVPSARSQPGV